MHFDHDLHFSSSRTASQQIFAISAGFYERVFVTGVLRPGMYWNISFRFVLTWISRSLENVDKFDADKNEVDKDILECVPFDDDYCGSKFFSN